MTIVLPNEVNADISSAYYQTVAASQTGAVLAGPSTTGAIGDYLAGILVIPATTSPGSIALLDKTTSITIFTGGSTSVADLKPFYIPIGTNSEKGPWSVTTGANVSIIAYGNFK